MTAPSALLARAGLAAVTLSVPVVSQAVLAGPASASTGYVDTGAANWIAYSIESDRSWVHLPDLAESSALDQVALSHAEQMASGNVLFDSPHLALDASWAVPGWTRLAENSGYGPGPVALAWAFVHSPTHLVNILGDFDEVGVGAVRSGSTLWVAEVFAQRG